MAIYAALGEEELAAVVREFGLAPPVQAIGVPEGSINTNYRLETGEGRRFLRHTTVRSPAELIFEAGLLQHLIRNGFPAPQLLPTRGGAPFLELAGGRASVFEFLAGEELSRATLTPRHLERLGIALGKLHRIGLSFEGDRPNPYRPQTVRGWLEGLERHADPELRAIAGELQGLLARSQRAPVGPLPRGVIHADVFLDNVKWVGDRLSAIFDFEMACQDALILDVAITLNAWCFDEGHYRPELTAALLGGYQQQRPLAPAEREHLWDASLFGAVRYTASRIRDFHLSPLPADRLFKKDFRTYLARARTLASLDGASFQRLICLGPNPG